MAAELSVCGELQVKTTPSAVYNNLSYSGTVFCFANQSECVVVRPLGPHKLPIADSDKSPITFTAVYSVRGRQVAVVCTSSLIQLWDTAKDTALARIPSDNAESRGCAVIEFGERLIAAFGHSDGTVAIWEFGADFSPSLLTHVQAHKAPVTSIASSSESAVLFVSADNSGCLQFWNTSFQPFLSIPSVHASECATSVAIAGSSFVAAAYGSGKIRLFSLSGEMRVEICGHARWINAMSFNRTRMLLATAGDDSTVAVWQLPTVENPRASLVGMRRTKNLLYTGVAFNSEGTQVLAAAFDNDKIVTLAVPS